MNKKFVRPEDPTDEFVDVLGLILAIAIGIGSAFLVVTILN